MRQVKVVHLPGIMITTDIACQSQSILCAHRPAGMLHIHTHAHIQTAKTGNATKKHETGTTLHNRTAFCLFVQVDGKKRGGANIRQHPTFKNQRIAITA